MLLFQLAYGPHGDRFRTNEGPWTTNISDVLAAVKYCNIICANSVVC